MAHTKYRRPSGLTNCRKALYRFCLKTTNRTYLGTKRNRRLKRVGSPIRRYILTKLRNQ